MHASFHQPNGRLVAACGELMQVRSLLHLEYLVKESEIVTCRPGRQFVIAGADRLVYHVQWLSDAYRVERLDDDGTSLCTLVLKPHAFHVHSLGTALQIGCLYTPMLAD